MGGPFFGSKPALRFVLLFAAGILLSHELEIARVAAFLVCAFLLLCALLAFLIQRLRQTVDIPIVLLVVSLGVLMYAEDRTALRHQRVESRTIEEPVELNGTVESVPQERHDRWRFVLNADSLKREGGITHRGIRALVFARKRSAKSVPPTQGTRISVAGQLQRFPMRRNPGEFDYGRYLELNEINAVVLSSDDQIRLLQSEVDGGMQTILPRVRTHLSILFREYHRPEVSSFLSGIILAERSGISEEVKQSFVNTGTIHVLAVSGLHVGIVALMFHAFFGLLRLPRHAVTICTMVGLVIYMALTGSPPSVTRATIMACVILFARFFERDVDVYQSLGIAALIILLGETHQLFHVGFQLSFAAVVSIVYLYPKLERLIKLIPAKYEEIKAIDYVLKLFAVSLAAQLGTLPFTAYYFDRVSIVALIANLVVVPIIGLNVMIGFATVIASAASGWLAHCFGAVNDLLVNFVLGFVEQAARLPYAFVETPNLNASFAFVYYLGIVVLFNVQNARYVKQGLVLILLLAIVHVYSGAQRSDRRFLTVTVLDVGQGDAIFLETPQGRRVLIDAGPKSPAFDAGERIIDPFLRRKGIQLIDAILLTHPHSDHIGGAAHILGNVAVMRLVESAAQGHSATYDTLSRIAAGRKIPVEVRSAGTTIDVDSLIRIYVIHPGFGDAPPRNQNDQSLAVRVVYGGTSFLFPGDAEAPSETKMVKRYGTFLGSDVLKAGHHGSKTSTSTAFLENVSPRSVIVSVGKKNRFSHPSPAVIDRLARKGITTLRTDDAGAIIMRSDGFTIERIRWRDSRNQKEF
ncbi:MAG: DNA internalization-related competence protein ComEC/Rec2 [Ignavibacteria bacterium]|nr:DNA internalization-related competence protein ComEC/Rec2 [Ignavibacteria bacterium]